MKTILYTSVKWIAAIYTIGYILVGYPNDTYVMRAITGLMSTIFAVNVLLYMFRKR